jgi:hypothetical protein
MDQNESENNEVPLPSKDSSDAKNPSKAEESLRQKRPREKKKKILVQELLGLNQVNSQNLTQILGQQGQHQTKGLTLKKVKICLVKKTRKVKVF